MTSHELAKRLLNLPDLEVVMFDAERNSDDWEPKVNEVCDQIHPDYKSFSPRKYSEASKEEYDEWFAKQPKFTAIVM